MCVCVESTAKHIARPIHKGKAWSGVASTPQQITLFSTHVLTILPKPLAIKEDKTKYFQILVVSF